MHRRWGYATAAQWLAARSGSSVGDASGLLEVARRVEGLAETRDAFVSGRLSAAQAGAVAGAAEADPGAEQALVAAAGQVSLRELREESRHVQMLAASDQQARYLAQRASRSFRRWVDDEGMVCGRFRLPPTRAPWWSRRSTTRPTGVPGAPPGPDAPGPGRPSPPTPWSPWSRGRPGPAPRSR
ncbi:MAG: hypothetical protein M5U14_05200 [Acidimicrobiia bacterium]|nr:hypothetical protein [Acidimicrobiia bacterium]